MLWIAGIVVLVLVTAGSTIGLYHAGVTRRGGGRGRGRPAALLVLGPDVALDTIGGQVAFQVGAVGLTTFVGLMSLLLVVRLTRGEEDSGRLELVRAMPVGRHASLAAALVVVGGADLLVGLLVSVVLVLSDLPVAGSIVLGVVHGRRSRAGAAALHRAGDGERGSHRDWPVRCSASFLLRAVGDAGSGALMGIADRLGAEGPALRRIGGGRGRRLATRAVPGRGGGAGSRGAVAGGPARLRGGPGAAATGPARATPGLRSPLALAFRLQRGAVVWWTVSVVAMAVAWGSWPTASRSSRRTTSRSRTCSPGPAASVTDGYLSTTLLFSALIAGGAALQVITRLRTEETEHRGDTVLATPVTRSSWAGGHLAAAFTASGLAVVAGGLGLGATYGLVVGDGQVAARRRVARVPAAGVAAGRFGGGALGAAPRWVAAAWDLGGVPRARPVRHPDRGPRGDTGSLAVRGGPGAAGGVDAGAGRRRGRGHRGARGDRPHHRRRDLG